MTLNLEDGLILHPPGTVGIPTGDTARFHQFTFSITKLLKPPGAGLIMNRGLSVAKNCNEIVRNMEGEWLWLMGDDHIFSDDILLRLLDRNVDVVVPLCWKSKPPFQLVIYDEQNADGEYRPIDPSELPTDGEIFPVMAAGSAGMLIRKHVLDEIGDPWFETTEDHQNEDLELCRKMREAGYTIYADPTVFLGHMGHFEIWPAKIDGNWGGMMVFGPDHKIFLNASQSQAVPVGN